MIDYDIASIYEEMENYLISSMKRNFSKHLDEEIKQGFKWEQWQAKKFRELTAFQKNNQKAVGAYANRIDKATKAILLEEYMQGGEKIDKEFSQVIKKGFSLKRGIPNDDFFQGESKQIKNLIKSVNEDFKNASGAVLRKMNDVYRQTIFKSAVFAGQGVMTPQQAIDMATKNFLERGIDCIIYKNGAKVNIVSYASMAVRTANKRAQLMGEGERRKEWGESLVLISQYMQCSPLCLPWQGKVYIDDVYSGGKASDGKYQLLSTAIAGGLFHPNCKHTASTFFDGISKQPKMMYSETDETLKKANKEKKKARVYERLKNGSLDDKNRKINKSKQKKYEKRSTIYKKLSECFKSVSLRGIDNDYSDEIKKRLLDLQNKYPITKKIKITTTANKKSFGYNSSNIIAKRIKKVNYVVYEHKINISNYHHADKIKSACNHNIEYRKRGSKLENIEKNHLATLDHEYGHAIDTQYTLCRHQELKNIVNQYNEPAKLTFDNVSTANKFNNKLHNADNSLSNVLWEKMKKSYKMDKKEFDKLTVRELGTYAKSDKKEFLAEGFANFRHVQESEKTEFLKRFERFFNEEFDEVIRGKI